MADTPQLLILGWAILLVSAPVFSEHRPEPTERPQVASRASECSKSRFESIFGLNELQSERGRSAEKTPYPLLGIETKKETAYVSGGVGGVGSYEREISWRYKAPDDRVFRLAVSDSLSCLIDNQAESSDFLSAFLNNESILQQEELLTDKKPAKPEDLQVFRKMKELFESLKSVLAKHRGEKDFESFFKAFFKQIQKTEQSLLSKEPKLELHPDLVKELEKLRLNPSGKLFEFVKAFSETPEFDYWMHPILANYFRKALGDPGFPLNSGKTMSFPLAYDLGRKFQQVLRGADGTNNLQGPAPTDPVSTQGRVVPGEDPKNEAQIVAPQPRDLLRRDLGLFSTRLHNPDRQKATMQDTAQLLARALNDSNAYFGNNVSPEHLALREAARAAITELTGNSSTAAQAVDLEGEAAQNRNDTDRKLLDPLRKKLEGALSGHRYPVSLDAIEKVSQYPDSMKELVQQITNHIQPKGLSNAALETLGDFLQTGETQHLFDLFFKSPGAFNGALAFIGSAKEAGPQDDALVQARSLLSKIRDGNFVPASDWETQYSQARNRLIDSISRLNADPARVKDRDAHLLALRLLDETGLIGVTSRDIKDENSDSYRPEIMYQELKAERAALHEKCKDDPNPDSCIERLEKNLLREARLNTHSSTGLTPKIRRNLLDTFSPDKTDQEKLHHYLERFRGGPAIRQAALFSGPINLDSAPDISYKISEDEQQQRIYRREEDQAEDPKAVAEKLPELFRYRREAALLGSELALKLSSELAKAGIDALEAPGDPEINKKAQAFYQCLSEKLIEQASDYNNVVALQALAQWYANTAPDARVNRLKIISAQLKCPIPAGLGDLFPPTNQDEKTRAWIQTQARKMEELSEKEKTVLPPGPGQLTERALIELEHLRRVEMEIERERRFFPPKDNAALWALEDQRERIIENLKTLGLSSVLEKDEMKKQLPSSWPRFHGHFATETDLQSLRSRGMNYDPITNSFVVTPETTIDDDVLKILSRTPGINLRYLGNGRTEELFIPHGGNARSLLALMINEAATFGYSPLSTDRSWKEISGLDKKNPSGLDIPRWFPLTGSTSARLVERADGTIEAAFIPTKELAEETRKKMEALIRARTDAYAAAAEYGTLEHAAKGYFGHMIGYDPSETSETIELRRAANRYASLRSEFAKIGMSPIAGTQMNSVEFNKNELAMMRDYLKREEEEIHNYLTNAETIHQLTTMILTSAMPVGNFVALEGQLAKIAAGTGKLAFAARQALRATRLAIQLRNATRSGMVTAAQFEALELGVNGILSATLPDSTEKIIADRIQRAKGPNLKDGWRVYKENPALDSKWGAIDQKTGLPVDTSKHADFRKAMLEFNIEESMDYDGDGVIDELQGAGGTPMPFARKRGFGALFTANRLQNYTESAAFFRNLGMAKALPVPRWINVPVEMAVAGGIQEASRSEESVQWEARRTGENPGSFGYRVGKAVLENFAEGGRFQVSGIASNAALSRVARGGPGKFNTLFGALLFAGVDSVTRAAVNEARFGQTGFERGSWEEFSRDLIRDNAVPFYIGLDIARSGLQREEPRKLKRAYLEGGEPALRQALEAKVKSSPEAQREIERGVIASINPAEFASASPEFQEAHLNLLDTRLKEASARLEAAQKAAVQAGGEAVVTPEQARRVGEINQELIRLFREGAWNHEREVGALLNEQDQIFFGVSERLARAQKEMRALEATVTDEAASSNPEILADFVRRSQALEAHQEVVNNLTEAAAGMAPLRVLAEPVQVVAALSDPRSSLAQAQFADSPHALEALQRHQKSRVRQAWEGLARLSGRLADEGLLPDLRRSDGGLGGVRELTLGERPSGSGITGREQRAAAEFVERVFKDKRTSMEEKRELLGIILQLDPVRADALAKSQTWDEKLE